MISDFVHGLNQESSEVAWCNLASLVLAVDVRYVVQPILAGRAKVSAAEACCFRKR